ncbi:Cof-type HAD-IIB family hydrolase [Rossellomorea aquimaris]|uniref:Cof-type HAD-IIB family hydrolase n=1 Tax=Rossellomorea aquimaris TaxID=189382 RepID=UPI001CD5F85A|nr:Cof-type HAD-IIB family hydrolase [Rossellomorea aquimaris]MCA1055772.1 Cof-type HAD-IIB family hydrolase [Rossellomorea aquimaris]
MEYKIVFFDIDGTLTHHEDGSIPQNTKDAIKLLKDKGLVVVAATGRPLSMCSEIRELGIDTVISANGAYVKHHEEVLHKVAMDSTVVKEVVEFSEEEKHGLSFYTEGFSMNGIQNADVMNALKETLSLEEYPMIENEIFNKEVYLMCLFADDEQVDKYIRRFPHLTFKRWHPFVLNVLKEDVSKSLAIKKVLDYFQLESSQAIAFGDGENDIDMLELAGLGIAMGNGHERLKEVADFVTEKSGEDGIVYALKEFCII